MSLIVNTGGGLPSQLQQTTNPPPIPCPQSNASGCGVTKGVIPVTAGSQYSVWTTSDGYTVLDLTQFSGFQAAMSAKVPLLFTFRNTLPGASFECSGFAVPFNTAEYTTAGGLMGPYVPQVSFVPSSSHALTITPTFSSLPSTSACSAIPSTLPNPNAPTPSNPVDYPLVYWSSTANATPPYLACPSTQNTDSTAIYFVATQYPTPALTEFGSAACTAANNSCSQIIVQSTQTTESPGEAAFQPPLPLAITGIGLGFLQQPLPYAGPASSLTNAAGAQLLIISDDGAGQGGVEWTTDPTQPHYASGCQVYVASWADSGIWLVANIPTGVQDGYLAYQGDAPLDTYLSPMSAVSPLTFPGGSTCPVVAGDHLVFPVTNPQGTGYATTNPIQVSGSGVTLF